MPTPVQSLRDPLMMQYQKRAMLKSDFQIDPVVEILRLAYRRGLAIQREQTEKSKATDTQSLQGDMLTVEQVTLIKESNQKSAGEGRQVMAYDELHNEFERQLKASQQAEKNAWVTPKLCEICSGMHSVEDSPRIVHTPRQPKPITNFPSK